MPFQFSSKLLPTKLQHPKRPSHHLPQVAEEATALRPEEYDDAPPKLAAALHTDRVAEVSKLTAPVVAVLDATSLRQTLAAMGLPVEGKISKLRERLSAAVQASK